MFLMFLINSSFGYSYVIVEIKRKGKIKERAKMR